MAKFTTSRKAQRALAAKQAAEAKAIAEAAAEAKKLADIIEDAKDGVLKDKNKDAAKKISKK